MLRDIRGEGSDIGPDRWYILSKVLIELQLHVVLFQIYKYNSILRLLQYQAEKSQNLISDTDVTGRISDLKVGSLIFKLDLRAKYRL